MYIIPSLRIYRYKDPFFIEYNIISFQRRWKYIKYYKKNTIIVKNIKKLNNYKDPISLDELFFRNKLIFDINQLYPIIRNNRMYIYLLENLESLINNGSKEVFSNSDFSIEEIKQIKFLVKKFKLLSKPVKLNKKEQIYLLRLKILQKIDENECYFNNNYYNKISNKLEIVFIELKMMWNSFCIDNCINEKTLLGENLVWKKYSEKKLLQNIDLMLNDKLNSNIKKMISYIIIGAFAYVSPEIKKIYSNIDFI